MIVTTIYKFHGVPENLQDFVEEEICHDQKGQDKQARSTGLMNEIAFVMTIKYHSQ